MANCQLGADICYSVGGGVGGTWSNWGLDPFGKQKLAYRLLKTFPRGGPLTASIWAIVTWMTGTRCLNELDCT